MNTLYDDICAVLDKNMEKEDFEKKVAELIKATAHTTPFDSNAFEQYFGRDASTRYLNAYKRMKHGKKHGNAETVEEKIQYFYPIKTTDYLQAAFYYACSTGCLPLVRYLVEAHHLPGNLTIKFDDHCRFMEVARKKSRDTIINGAVESGNVEVVQYLYENTNAMIETATDIAGEDTPLMTACRARNLAMMTYLIAHGANVNAKKDTINDITPLNLAIDSGSDEAIRLLVNAGAIVMNGDINQAIQQGLSFTTIEFLILNRVQKENAYSGHLMSAVLGGNVENLKKLEEHSAVIPFSEIAKYSKKDLKEQMAFNSLQSGSMEMVKYLAVTHQVPFKQLLVSETNQRLRALFRNNDSEITQIQKTGATFLYAAAEGANKKGDLAVLKYLFEDLGVVPSSVEIEKICAFGFSLKVYAYLCSFINNYSYRPEREELYRVAFELDTLSLRDLFVLYRSNFIQYGNKHRDKYGSFTASIEPLIKEKLQGVSLAELSQLLKDDKTAMIGALFFFCIRDYDQSPEYLISLLDEALSNGLIYGVDIQNCRGKSLAYYAQSKGSNNILKLLLARGADPDLPDEEGQTLINRLLGFSDHDQFEWIKPYLKSVKNSLKYVEREFLGDRKTAALLSAWKEEHQKSEPLSGLGMFSTKRNNQQDDGVLAFKKETQNRPAVFW